MVSGFSLVRVGGGGDRPRRELVWSGSERGPGSGVLVAQVHGRLDGWLQHGCDGVAEPGPALFTIHPLARPWRVVRENVLYVFPLH